MLESNSIDRPAGPATGVATRPQLLHQFELLVPAIHRTSYLPSGEGQRSPSLADSALASAASSVTLRPPSPATEEEEEGGEKGAALVPTSSSTYHTHVSRAHRCVRQGDLEGAIDELAHIQGAPVRLHSY
jgi:hypothetical protein|eukprot:COSAG01_NODE_10495_length_2151_cov_6.033138_2_plen_130_part_00